MDQGGLGAMALTWTRTQRQHRRSGQTPAELRDRGTVRRANTDASNQEGALNGALVNQFGTANEPLITQNRAGNQATEPGRHCQPGYRGPERGGPRRRLGPVCQVNSPL